MEEAILKNVPKENIAILVDRYGEEIGCRPRPLVRDEDRHLITSVWLRNSEHEVLIARRHPNKKLHPGLWSASAAGTVTVADKSPSDNAYQEVFEELGLRNVSLRLIGSCAIDAEFEGGRARRFCYWFTGKTNHREDEFVLEEGKVAEVKWVSKRWLLKDIVEHPKNYTPSSYLWPAVLSGHLPKH